MKFYVFREDCLDKYLAYDFQDMECHKFTISKLIGFAIVVGSGIVKLPQIIKILQKSSVEGISQFTLYIEVSRAAWISGGKGCCEVKIRMFGIY